MYLRLPLFKIKGVLRNVSRVLVMACHKRAVRNQYIASTHCVFYRFLSFLLVCLEKVLVFLLI